jgi:predicted Zn-dependent peptidase
MNMKLFKYFIPVVLLSVIASVSTAQLDRSTPPEAGPAPKIQFDNPPSFTLDNGLEVIVVENHELPVVHFQLTVDADPVREGEAKGYVAAAGNLLRNGTKDKTKSEIDKAVDFIGADLYTYQNGIYASGLKKHAGRILNLMAEVTMQPVFPEEELDKYKKNQISNLTAGKTDPSQISSRVARKLRYGDHPYGELQTEATIENITREKCMEYHQTYYKPNISYLVMMGDIRQEEAREMAEEYYGDWQKGDVPEHQYDYPQTNDGRQVALVNKDDAVQSVISITYPVELQPGDEDAIPARLMNNILGGGVFSGYLMQNLREDKGYTYGARSQLNSDPLVGYFRAGAQVGTEVTDSAIHEFLYEMDRIRTEPVEKEHLKMAKSAMTGSFARSLEDSRTMARYALNTKRYDLPDDYYATYLQKAEQVSQDKVQETARKYVRPDQATVLVVGNKNKVQDKIARFADKEEVALYTREGEPVREAAAVPEDMTAQKVIENSIEARGGRENLSQIKDIQETASVSMGPRTIVIKTYREKPNKMAIKTMMNGSVVQEQVFDGEKGHVTAMGQTQELSGKQLETIEFQARMHKFLRYDELGVKLSLEGTETVEGKTAYKVKVTNPDGVVRYDFFDVDSGLKVKTKQTITSPQGERTSTQTFSDYREVNGVKFPFRRDVSGMRSMTVKVDSIKVNDGIEEAVFQ